MGSQEIRGGTIKLTTTILFFIIVIPAICFATKFIFISSPQTGGEEPFEATDTFNRSNSDTLGSLSGGTYTWSEVDGDIDIESNQAHLGTAGQAVAIIGADISAATVEVDGNCESQVYAHPGVVFWYEDSDNFWYVHTSPNATDDRDVEVYQTVAGSSSEVADGAVTISSSTTYNIKVDFSATEVNVFIDDVQYVNHTGSFGSNSGDIGIYHYRGAGASGWVDNFYATNQ
jgi:hypothetical protein